VLLLQVIGSRDRVYDLTREPVELPNQEDCELAALGHAN
jgi:hypothetical protein